MEELTPKGLLHTRGSKQIHRKLVLCSMTPELTAVERNSVGKAN